jgi:hypothetical protein
MRTDVFDNYITIFEDHKKSCIDLDEIMYDDSAVLNEILKTSLDKIGCKNLDCGCRELNVSKIKKQKYKDIGIPLQIQLLGLHHDFIRPFFNSKDLFQVIVSHFDKMQTENARLYGCLMYIVAKGKYKKSDIDRSIAEKFQLEVSHEGFEECEQMSYLERVSVQDSTQGSNECFYCFKHVFLYLCAFHSLFKSNSKVVMQFCKKAAVLEIVLPHTTESNIKFCVKADDKTVMHFYDHVVEAKGLMDTLKDHPLVIHAKKFDTSV